MSKLIVENINLIEEQGDKAAYSPAEDQITLPLMEQFISAEEFYATAFHEMVHSTCQENRCNRLINTNPFSKEYAKEELIAEIGAAFLLNFAGIEHDETEKNNVSYIQAWLRHLQDDNRFIISASGKAEKAVEYIQHGNQKEEEVIAA